jgi:serine/threonine protein kinase
MTDLRTQLQEGSAASYTLERELGRGGMATVFLAQDLKHDRPVALKVLHPELAMSLGPERFQREIRFAARLQHPTSSPCTIPARPPASSGSPCPTWRASRCGTGCAASTSSRWRPRSGSPIRDATFGTYIQHQLARIYVVVGQPERALPLLEPLLRVPYTLSPEWLRIDPNFAPLRGNPQFERLVRGAA